MRVRGLLRRFRLGRPEPERGTIGLVLAGGGLAGGMFEVGCLTALDEFLDPHRRVNDFDLFVGVSAGALVAAFLANGVRPRDAYEAIRQDLPSPLNLKRADIVEGTWRAAWVAVTKMVRDAASLAAAAVRARPHGLGRTLPRLLAESLPAGLFSLERLDAHLARFLSTPPFSNDFRTLRRPLFIPAVALDTGERWVFGEPALQHVPISRAVAASSAIPGFFEPVTIDGTDLVDGGVDRVEHLDIAVAHGATAILLINPIVPFTNLAGACLPRLAGGCALLKEKGGTLVKEQAARLNRQRKLILSLERHRLEFPEMPVFLIEPDPTASLMFVEDMMSDSTRLGALEHGYRVAREWLAAHGGRLQDLLAARASVETGRNGSALVLQKEGNTR